jgi:serine/threonine protein kinase
MYSLLKSKGYKVNRKLGNGTYGNVYVVTQINTNKKFAYKSYKRYNKDIEVGVLREISLLQMLKQSGYCENYGIICIVDVIISTVEIGILLPLYHNSLHNAITENILSDLDKINITNKLLKSICFLHKNNIIHRDIKPDNIMLDENYNPILIDFTLAKVFNTSITEETHTGVVASKGYRAPEVDGIRSYGFPVDAWSLGMVINNMYDNIPLIFSKFLDSNPNTRLIPHDALSNIFNQSCGEEISNNIETILVDETISTICKNLEMEKKITYTAAQFYYNKTQCDPYMAVVMACKYYENCPLDIEFLGIETDFIKEERDILEKMDYNLNVIE